MWQQLTIAAESSDCEALEALLLEAGAASISYLDAQDQPVFQEVPGSTPLWDESVVMALFPAEDDLRDLIATLRFHPRVKNRDGLQAEILQDEDWVKRWMDEFRPMRFGDRLWICPSWMQPPHEDAVTLMLDPGLAFGSGTHPTTAMCLRWLDGAELPDKQVIDYGCGSGVLGLAAALLGARRVDAVDNDPQALSATRSNATNNGIDSAQLPTWSPEDFMAQSGDDKADLLLANILAQPLIELAPRFADLLRPAGELLLSGLLRTQIEQVQAAYAADFDFESPVTEGDWACLWARRRA